MDAAKKLKTEACIRELDINNDMLTVEEKLGPFNPELRRAIRWVAYRAAAREACGLADVLRRRGDELDEAAARDSGW